MKDGRIGYVHSCCAKSSRSTLAEGTPAAGAGLALILFKAQMSFGSANSASLLPASLSLG